MAIATSSDVSDFDGSLTLPANVDRWLTIAAGLVADAVALSVYVPDVDGLPSSVPHRAAMRDAVSAQVAWWITTGADPTGAGDSAGSVVVTAKSLTPVGSVSYDPQAQREASAARAASTRYLCAEAWGILRRAGLARAVVVG
jgi:hypothetical protein